MTNTDDYTKTIYLVIINRFSCVSKDIATAIMHYDTEAEAQAFAQKKLTEEKYSCLRFAVSIAKYDIVTMNPKFVHFSGPVGYIETKMATNLAALDPLSPTTKE